MGGGVRNSLKRRVIVFSTFKNNIVTKVLIDGYGSGFALVYTSTGTRPVGFISRCLIARESVVANF